MKRVTFGDVDTTDEVAKMFNKVIDNLTIVEAKVCQLNDEVDSMKRPEKKKKKGFVLAKLLIAVVLIAALGVTAFGADSWPITYDNVSNPEQLVQLLRNRFANQTGNYFTFDPTDITPTASEGRVYYNDSANALQLYNGTSWMTIDVAGGVSLDGAYDFGGAGLGAKILVDTAVVELETADAAGIPTLLLDYNDATTNAMDVLQITNAGDDAAAVSIQIDGTAGYDIQGTGDTWNVSVAGLGSFVGVTTTSELIVTASDVLFDDTYDVAWDTSRDTLLFQDNAICGFGGAHDAAADTWFTHDGSNLTLDALIADEGWLIGTTTTGFDITYAFETAGQFRTDYDGDFINLTDDMDLRFGTGASANGDFQISSNSSNVLAIEQVTADTGTMTIGADGTDIPLTWYAETASDFVRFTTDDLQLEDVSLCIAEGTQIQFGDPLGAGDITIACASNVLSIDVVVPGTGSLAIGNDADDVPLVWYAETTGAETTFTGDDIQIDGMSLCLGESDQLQFGDALGTGDFQINSTSDVLTIGQVAAGTGTIAIGVDNKGIDTKFFGETAGDYLLWDQDGGTNLGALIFEDSVLQFAGANVTYSTAISTDALAITATDHANASITIGTTGTTNSIDVTINAATAGNTVVFDGGAESLTLTDVDLICTAPDAADVAATFNAGGANTASVVQVDGATGAAAWVGAANVGMVHITSDGALADVASSLLYIANSGVPTNDSRGSSLRIVDTGNAAAGTAGYAVYLSATDATVEALYVDTGNVLVDEEIVAGIGCQSTATAVTATTGGGTTGIIPRNARIVVITSDSADKQVTLPSNIVGMQIALITGATACEVICTDAGAKINDIVCGATNEAALVADSHYELICISATEWIMKGYDKLGAHVAPIVPDAL